jgi:TRAP-type mannitol/chloroaromatic compound transport system permease small subunit
MEVAFGRLDRLNQVLGRTVSWLTLLMVILTLLIVVLRKWFGIGSIALQESVLYAHATVIMVGIAVTWRVDEHVRVDVFYSRLSSGARARVDLAGMLLLLIPLCIFLFVISIDYVLSSWGWTSRGWTGQLEGSPEAGGLPLVFALKTLLPIMALLLLSQTLVMFRIKWQLLRSSERSD